MAAMNGTTAVGAMTIGAMVILATRAMTRATMMRTMKP